MECKEDYKVKVEPNRLPDYWRGWDCECAIGIPFLFGNIAKGRQLWREIKRYISESEVSGFEKSHLIRTYKRRIYRHYN